MAKCARSNGRSQAAPKVLLCSSQTDGGASARVPHAALAVTSDKHFTSCITLPRVHLSTYTRPQHMHTLSIARRRALHVIRCATQCAPLGGHVHYKRSPSDCAPLRICTNYSFAMPRPSSLRPVSTSTPSPPSPTALPPSSPPSSRPPSPASSIHLPPP